MSTQIVQINSRLGRYDGTCTVSANLTEAGIKRPEIRDIVQYSEPRMITTLLTSGATDPYQAVVGSNELRTKIGTIPEGKLIGDNQYRYAIMGRIQRASIINGLVGTPSADGYFQLSLKDDLLYDGMNVTFYDEAIQARVMGDPTGTDGNYIYNFQTHDGALFVYATAVGAQIGQKTCFGQFTSYSEASLRGHSRAFHPDWFTQFMTIQRQGAEITGSAMSDVIWLAATIGGKESKGWFFKKQRQMRLQMMLQNEYAKVFGRSTMKDSSGNVKARSNQFDPRTQKPIITGDGMIPQIEGGNELIGSGTDGYATVDDFMDMLTTLKKHSNGITGMNWAVITGPTGYSKAQRALQQYWLAIGGRMNVSNTVEVGGAKVSVGGNFNTFNVDGNSCTFFEHPMFGDEQRWAGKASDGVPYKDGMYLFIDRSMDQDGTSNIEILGKGGNNVNRTFVEKYLNGMTGWDGSPSVTSVDALQYEILMEDMLCIYNTKSCGIIHRGRV